MTVGHSPQSRSWQQCCTCMQDWLLSFAKLSLAGGSPTQVLPKWNASLTTQAEECSPKGQAKNKAGSPLLPGRIHTSDISLLPFGNTPEMSVPTNLNFTYQLNLTSKTRNKEHLFISIFPWHPSTEEYVQTLKLWQGLSNHSILKRIRPNPA